MSQFATNFRRLRKATGMSMSEFAQDFGVHLKQIARWETGETSISIEKAIDLAKTLNVSLDELCGLQSDNKDTVDISRLSDQQKKAVRTIVEGLLK